MGCDIHAFVEFFDKNSTDTHARAFSSNICFGRDYELFGLLAGVRGFSKSVFPVRGIPKNLSYDAHEKYYIAITDSITSPNILYPHSTKYISRSLASQFVANGESIFSEDKNFIVDPAWHTPSWLNKNELIEIRRQYLIDMMDFDTQQYTGKKRTVMLDTLENCCSIELMQMCLPSLESVSLNAVIASMIAIENTGEYESRLVFWFDS